MRTVPAYRLPPELIDGPGPEWYRELAAERDGAAEPSWPAGIPPLPQPEPPASPPGAWCDDCGYRIGSAGHQRECGPSAAAPAQRRQLLTAERAA